MRARLTLTAECSNSCVFCAQSGADIPLSELPAALDAAAAGEKRVSFVGGEPAMASGVVEAIAAARARGIEAVGIQSNARGLAEALPAMAGAGLTDVHLSLHGASADVHEYHTQTPGSFDEVARAAATARRLGIEVSVVTVVTRSNFRVLAPLVEKVSALGARNWLCEMVVVGGAAGPAFDRLVPRLGLAVPHVLHALSSARKRGLSAYLRGAPACLLGPYASWLLPSPTTVRGSMCASCPASACSGADPHYLARFGEDELRVREAYAPETAPDVFVGVGPVASPQLPRYLAANPDAET